MWYRYVVQGYKAPEEGPGEYQTIPLDKIEDFGVHCKQVSVCVCSSN
jgi:COP9 signalosome complex subunit 5